MRCELANKWIFTVLYVILCAGGDYDRLPYLHDAPGRIGGGPFNGGFLGSLAVPQTGRRQAPGLGPPHLRMH